MAKETPGQRLKRIRQERGYVDAKQFARAVGVNHRTYLAHEADRGLLRNVARYASFLGVSIDEIVAGEKHNFVKKEKYPQPLLALRPIPVLALAELNSVKSVAEMLAISSYETTAVGKTESIGPKARGWRIPDDSMTDVARKYDISFHAEEMVILDPDRPALPGKFVVARLFNPNRTVCRMFSYTSLGDGSRAVKLIPLNPYYPEETIKSEQDGFILGRVVRRISDL